MAWRLAPSLGVLRQQVDEVAPKRSKKADGTIGDAAHAARKSDHNPDKRGVVTAIDLTHDPVNGADMEQISERLRTTRDRRVKYVIWNRRFFSPKTGWQWTKYSGPSPHDKHMHVSVEGAAHLADDTISWIIGVASEDEMSLTDARLQVAAAWFAASGEWMSPQPPEDRQTRLTRLAGEVFGKKRTAAEVATFAVRVKPSDSAEAVPAWVTSADLPFV